MNTKPEFAMDEIARRFKIVGNQGLSLVTNYPYLIRKLPPRLDKMSLDEVVAFKNQLEVCNKKYNTTIKHKRPKQSLISFVEEISALLRFYH